MDAVTSPTLWSTVAALPDYLLLAQTRQLARHEQALQILVLDHLREIEARRLHLTRGYGSLFDYVVHELGYTAAAAWRRIKAMRLCTGTDSARELLRDGSLNLSNAAQLQNLFERSDRSDRSRGGPPVSDGAGGGLGEAPRNDGAPGEPPPAAPMHGGERDLAPVAGPVLDAAAREKLVRQAAGKSTREVQQMLAEVDPELAQPSDRMRALAGGRWELKAAVDAECRHGLEKLLMLLSHTDPHLTLGGLVARLVREGLHRYDPERPPSPRRPRGGASVAGVRTPTKPARRDTETVQRNAARAKGRDVERSSGIERGDTPLAADGDGTPRPSAPKRQAEGERGSTEPAAVRDIVCGTASAAKRRSEVEHGSVPLEEAPSSVGRPASPAKRHSGTEHGSASPVAAPNSGGRHPSPAKREAEAEHGGARFTAVRDIVRGTASAAKRRSEVEHGSVPLEEAPSSVGRPASPAKRHSGTEHGSMSPVAAPNSGGRHPSPAKREAELGRASRAVARDGGGRAVAAARRDTEAERSGASSAAEPTNSGQAASAAKRLAYAAGLGAVGPVERSPALQRHLAALRCCGAVPGSRSRYIPVAVKREVWRRDQGRCSYVDPHSGRRCGSRYRLEIDHVVPFALGGRTELFNLRVRCRAHHRLRHARAERVPPEARRSGLHGRSQGTRADGRSHAAIDPAGG